MSSHCAFAGEREQHGVSLMVPLASIARLVPPMSFNGGRGEWHTETKPLLSPNQRLHPIEQFAIEIYDGSGAELHQEGVECARSGGIEQRKHQKGREANQRQFLRHA